MVRMPEIQKCSHFSETFQRNFRTIITRLESSTIF